MNLYYKNEILYVDLFYKITKDSISLFKNRLFRILDDYGIHHIVISLYACFDKEAISSFKHSYYERYTGYLHIK